MEWKKRRRLKVNGQNNRIQGVILNSDGQFLCKKIITVEVTKMMQKAKQKKLPSGKVF